MEINRIFTNNQSWIDQKIKSDPQYFEKLSKGQYPDILYIGCSDSRVSAEELMGVSPGDVFVLRNIANVIPNSDIGSQSVISYAVSYLKVKHVVVCGHYNCGGIKAAMESADMGILNSWLRNIRDVYRLHRAELDVITDEEERYRRLVELNVQEQCVNVLKTADVQRANKERNLSVHGWVFDLKTGELRDLKIDFNSILSDIKKIYKIV